MENILHSKILGQGNPLLILHGFLGSGDNWISLGRKFSEYFEVHLMDLRNHGRSFHDDEMNYEIMCQDVLNYCQHHNLDQISILGHSMGGKIAMYLAVHHPKLVVKLIVVDIAPRGYSNRHQLILKALEVVDFSKNTSRKAIEQVFERFIENKSIRQFLLKNVYRKTSEHLDYRFNLTALLENYHLINESLTSFSQFDGDTLFLKGEYSDYILESDIPLIEAHFPGVIIKEIAKSGHWLHAENPKDFYGECIDFLR